jgi:hypothetical protein
MKKINEQQTLSAVFCDKFVFGVQKKSQMMHKLICCCLLSVMTTPESILFI